MRWWQEPWRVIAVAAVLAVPVGILAWTLLNGDASTGDDPTVAATALVEAVPTTVPSDTETAEPTPTTTTTPAPSASPTPTVTPPPTPTIEPAPPGQTVLFRGGPATGPWQQIGSVAEITHPDAPPTASYAYREGWSDPNEENQSPELWDQIVAEVAAQAVQLGPPADRPIFDAAPGTEAFNAFGGIEDIYFEDNVFSAIWSAVYLDDDVAVQAYFPYLIAFTETASEVIARGERLEIREDEVPAHELANDMAVQQVRQWVQEQLEGTGS